MARIEISIDGLSNLGDLDLQVRNKVEKIFVEAMEVYREIMLNNTSRGFSGTKQEEPFPPLSEDYGKLKMRRVGNSSANLRMDGSINDTVIKGTPTGSEMEFVGYTYNGKRSAEVFGYHQRGDGFNPQRKLVPETVDEIPQQVIDFINKRLEEEFSDI